MASKMLKSTNRHLGSLAILLVVAVSLLSVHSSVEASNKKDINRKSIVFDVKTPKVFYCPQEKQSDYSKTIVKAKPLDKLCEFGGKAKPKGNPSDCYNDVDETEFACDEKKRFLLRSDPPVDDPSLPTMAPETYDDLEFILSKGFARKKSAPSSGTKL